MWSLTQLAYQPAIPAGEVFRHALSTPLSTLKMALEIALETADQDAQPWLEQAQAALQHILELAASTQDHHTQFSAATALTNCLRLATPTAQTRLLSHLTVPASTLIEGNQWYFQEAILCLITNALQATSQGVVSVCAFERSKQLEIHLSDTGRGMDPMTQYLVTWPGVTTKKVAGGLGLPFARRVVTELGGTLSLRSWPHHGTSILIKLPCDHATHTPLPALSQSTEPHHPVASAVV